jgi:hypothetical protein
MTTNWHDSILYQQQNNSSSSSLTSASSLPHPYDLGFGGKKTTMSMILSPIIPIIPKFSSHPREPTVIDIPLSAVTHERDLPASISDEVPKMEHVAKGEGKGKAQITTLDPSHRVNLKEFGALLHFKFSPDGKYLATTRCVPYSIDN